MIFLFDILEVSGGDKVKIIKQQVDQKTNPVGYTFQDPAFSWIAESEGNRQKAYRIQIRKQYSSALFFDSGKVESEESHRVKLHLTLDPETRYYWRVRVWDDNNGDSDWSEEQYFETGKVDGEWNAEWIGIPKEKECHPYLRRRFALKDTVLRGRLYVCGLGLYEMHLNGERIGDELFTPGFTAYDAWQQVHTFDVTEMLHVGDNMLGAMLGNGWYKGRFGLDGNPGDPGIYGDRMGLLCELHIEYLDHTTQVIASDGDWQWQEGPILASSIYDGEIYDAGKEIPGWDGIFSSNDNWNPVEQIENSKMLPVNRLGIPVRITETRPVSEVIHTPRGEWVLDFGQNLVGWVHIKAPTSLGQRIELVFGEVLDPMGNFYHENTRSAQTRNVYLSRGGEVDYTPHFTFFGFRYVCVKGMEEPDPDWFTAEVIHSDMERIGFFKSNDPKLNRLYENTIWSQRGNFLDIPTDCPQRDERLGWTGDAQIFAATASMHYDTDAFYTKYLKDLSAEQEKNGWVPMYVPFCRNIQRDIAPCAGWGDAATIIPWTMYLHYGDTEILKKQYQSMKNWVDYMDRQAGSTHLYGGLQLGDWLAQDTSDPDSFYGATPLELTATAYFAYSTKIVAKTAKILEYEQDFNHYYSLYDEIIDSFHKEFVTERGRITSETQTAQALLVSMGILRKEYVPRAIEQLTVKLEENNYHLTTGFLGTPCLCPALADNGQVAYAYELLLNETYPSWLYEVNRGATTVWERWNSIREDGTLGAVNMNSFNHYSYGSVSQFLYEQVAGIRTDEHGPGYRRIRFIPRPHSRLTEAEAKIQTPYGEVSCGWKITAEGIAIRCKVPFNTSGRIILPDSEGVAEIQGGVGARRIQNLAGNARYELKPGEYWFRYRPNGKSIYQEVEQKIIRLI